MVRDHADVPDFGRHDMARHAALKTARRAFVAWHYARPPLGVRHAMCGCIATMWGLRSAPGVAPLGCV